MIGPNGSGKTSFLRALLGQMEPLDGEFRLGASLKVGYFAQSQEDLDPELTVLDEIIASQEMDPGRPAATWPNTCSAARMSYARQRLERWRAGPVGAGHPGLKYANFLLLDEPTNHLDIPAREALQEVLQISGHHPVGLTRPLPG